MAPIAATSPWWASLVTRATPDRPRAGELGTAHNAFAEVAKEHGVSPQQVALAWELAAADVVVPIPGASRPESAVASAAASELLLTAEQIARLDAA